MGTLHLRLFGGFAAKLDSGLSVNIPAKKTRGLMAYLALQSGKMQSRDKLADLLWSGWDNGHGHNSLRQALTGLRKALNGVDPPPLFADREAVALEPATLEVDALDFERLLFSEALADLERATDLYQGDLLEGIGIHDPVFDAWLRDERARYRELATRALTELLDHLSDSGKWERAIRVAQRLLDIDPFQEPVHRSLMRLYAQSGERSAALRQYNNCRALLDHDLGVKPEAATEALFQAIRQGQAVSSSRAAIKSQPDVAGSKLHPPPEKPSVAVLPFTHRGRDPRQEEFSDRITENIITDLLHFSDLKVIECGQALTSKDPTRKVADLARDYGVRYVVRGSIQCTDEQLRVSAQLIDATTSTYVWGDHYDRTLENAFSTLDEITRQIAATLGGIRGVLYGAEFKRIDRNAPENADPFAFYVRGLEHTRKFTKDANAKARQSFERAIRLEPGFSSAFAELARAHHFDYWYEWSDDPDGSLSSAEVAARKAVLLNLKDAEARLALGMVYYAQRRHNRAIAELHAGMALNPNYALLKSQLGEVLTSMGRLEEAFALIEEARRLDPLNSQPYLGSLGYAHFVARDYENAISALSKRAIKSPTTHLHLAASYAQSGREAEARSEVAQLLRLCPGMTAKRTVEKEPYVNADDREHLRDALRKAGLPA